MKREFEYFQYKFVLIFIVGAEARCHVGTTGFIFYIRCPSYKLLDADFFSRTQISNIYNDVAIISTIEKVFGMAIFQFHWNIVITSDRAAFWFVKRALKLFNRNIFFSTFVIKLVVSTKSQKDFSIQSSIYDFNSIGTMIQIKLHTFEKTKNSRYEWRQFIPWDTSATSIQWPI